jgi:hypothetical protein
MAVTQDWNYSITSSARRTPLGQAVRRSAYGEERTTPKRLLDLLRNEYASLHAIPRPVRHHSPLRDNLQPITLDLEEARLLCAIRGSKQHLLR